MKIKQEADAQIHKLELKLSQDVREADNKLNDKKLKLKDLMLDIYKLKYELLEMKATHQIKNYKSNSIFVFTKGFGLRLSII